MNINKIAIISDTHFGVKGDAPWMLDFQEEFYSNVFFPRLLSEGVDVILHLGDLFDRRKFINFVSLKRTRDMFLQKLVDYNMKMYIIPGNHDVTFKSTNEVNSLNTLLGEFKSSITVIESPTELQFGNTKFLMLPWMNQENESDFMSRVEKSTADILCGHLDIIGFDMYKGMPSTHGYEAKLFSKFSQVWTGHYHTRSIKGNIFYVGSPMEFTWSDSEDPRGFHFFETANPKNALRFIPNQYILHKKVWYADDTTEGKEKIKNFDFSELDNKLVKIIVGRKTDQKLFDNFLDKVYNTKYIDLTVIEDFSEFAFGLKEDSEDELSAIKSQSTKELLSSFIEKLETDLDKTRLEHIITKTYIEAVHMDSGIENGN